MNLLLLEDQYQDWKRMIDNIQVIKEFIPQSIS